MIANRRKSKSCHPIPMIRIFIILDRMQLGCVARWSRIWLLKLLSLLKVSRYTYFINTAIYFSAYFPPTPPPGTGTFRYISALYEQLDDNFYPDVPFFRVFFNLSEWLSDKNICGPVAATQFRTQSAILPDLGIPNKLLFKDQ